MDLLGIFFISISQNIVLFFQTKWNVGFKAALFRQIKRKFLLCNKSKMLQFSRIKKMCCFKRATFCIIQRKVKRRYNLLVQIFIFLLRCLLNLVKVHIMLCTFKNGTIKSLILILSMFKRFFFIFIWHGIKNCNAEILLGVASNAAEILHGVACNAAEILQGTTLNAAEILQSLMTQACKNSARLDFQCCRNSA